MTDLASAGMLNNIFGCLRSTATNASGNIASGGTAQTLWVGTTVPKNGFFIHNPKTTGDLWVGLTSTAAAAGASGSVRVPANGGTFQTPDDMAPTLNTTISIFAGTTGHPFTAFGY